MWGSSEEPPGSMEAGPPESVANLKESCEQNKNQLESVKDIMLRNKESLKKREEELQEYAKKLNKYKTRAKAARSSKDDVTSSNESTPKSRSEISIEPSDDVDDISQAKTPKAKSSLLQKKLAEDRKIFEQRSKELTESKRAVEEKVEALRQQLEEKYVAPVSVVSPVLVTSQTALPLIEVSHIQDKDNKITELNNKIFELEAMIIDLQDNLKEKDSVIDSKTKAITLMSADLSMKGKITLDTLEDTKDEMRSMQENFVLVESSLRNKNDDLIKQLEEKAEQISSLEENIQSLTDKLDAQKQAETISADFSRSTMDTLVDTKDAMKSMQENFVLIETSLKNKNEHLLKQLEEREIKLAEAEARILNLEAGLGIERQPNVEELLYKADKLEQTNRNLQDEKYNLQKDIAELQGKIISSESQNNNDVLIEKDNKIAELEDLVASLTKSNQALEENKAELQQEINNLTGRNQELSSKVEELSSKVEELSSKVVELENEKSELSKKLTISETETPKEDERVEKLTKELEELNKSMIKLKAQHKNKLKNLQKQLENFKKVSDTNAELVKLGNQVALLEEEKGNLQLSLVDFDELKASAGDLQERINDLEGKVSTQAKEIKTHIEAIAILENQKLDLMQELHAVKQEVSSLEAENAESENLRVTAEMKVVDLEEELESLHKHQVESLTDSERSEFQRQIETLTQENERLSQKISKMEELKSSSEVGSTESFVKTGSNVDSTESFEAIAADADKAELLRKIDGLTRENGALLEKLTRYEEKGSSDTGSTESFERIPEHGESTSKLENLTRENYELVIKLTKLEEKLAAQESEPSEAESRLQLLIQENERLIAEISQLQERLTQIETLKEDESTREKRSVEDEIIKTQLVEVEQIQPTEISPIQTETDINVQELTAKLDDLISHNETLTNDLLALREANDHLERQKQELVTKLEEKSIQAEKQIIDEKELKTEEPIIVEEKLVLENSAEKQIVESEEKSSVESAAIASLESEIERCNTLIAEQKSVIDDMKTKLAEKEEELERKSAQITSDSEAREIDAHSLRRELEESASVIAEWKLKCSEMEDKIGALERSKQHIEEGFEALQIENKNLVEQSEQKDALVSSLKEELDSAINNFEIKIKEQTETISSQEKFIEELKGNVQSKDHELQTKYSQLQNDLIKMDELQDELTRLTAQVQQKDSTISSLTEEVEALRTNVSVVEEDLFSTRHQLTDLHEKLENSKSITEYNQIMERLNDKEILVEELENKVSQKISEINALKTHAETLAAENERLHEQLQEEERKITDLHESNKNQGEALRDAERDKAEVENRLLDLQATHEDNLKHAKNITSELQNAYRMLEQLKIKHTEDMDMLNRRLEDVIEENQSKTQEILSLQSELDEKNNAISKCVSEDIKSSLESRVIELESKLAEAEEKTQTQLEKMKKYAALAKKKTTQSEELEARLKELEENINLEKSEKEARNKELQESLMHIQEKDNKIIDMQEELQRLQTERDETSQNMESIKIELNEAKERLKVLNDEISELSEAKDNARELGVRMQVMETEYMEQLAEINSLKAQNGFLQSKQTQINERLENVEKESEERRALIEKLEREREIEETERGAAGQEICEQCLARVQQLEAKLQERDAEIENLDNELHNSIGNLVQMQENLRLSTIPQAPDAALQESYNELVTQFNLLRNDNEENKTKFEAVLRENENLTERFNQLQELNITSHERIEIFEKELTESRVAIASLETVRSQYTELLDRFENQKIELEAAQTRLHEAIVSNESTQRNLQLQIELLEQDKQTLKQELDSLKSLKNNWVQDDGWGDLEPTPITIGNKAQQQQEPVNETMERQKREVDEVEHSAEKEESPPLFDASVFGAPSTTQASNAEQELEINRLRDEISSLQIQLEDARAAAVQILTEEHQQMTHDFYEKQAFIDSMNAGKVSHMSELELLTSEKQEIDRIVDRLLSSLSTTDEVLPETNKLQILQVKLDEILSELDTVKTENQQFIAAQEVYKNRLFELEKEVKTTSDSAIIAELENRISKVISERDILQLQVNDVTRAYEDLKEYADNLKNVHNQFEIISKEKNQLMKELEALRVSKTDEVVVKQEQPIETAASPSKPLEHMGESMWEDDEDPWGFNDKTIPMTVEEHVDIPIVPSIELQLQHKVDELEEKLKELTEENAKLIEEGKVAQVKNVKYVKKLKEYKIQFDSLQRELKSQRSIGGFGDLDSAIEEELKKQVNDLEKALNEAKEEIKKSAAEKEKLLNRIDVLTAATETFTEAKEKQDNEVYIWQMRYKELEMKLQQLDFGPETKDSSSSPPQEPVQMNPKYEEEMKELKDNIEALAAENEELQQLLEENRSKRQVSVDEFSNQVQDLQAKNSELTANNDKLKADYDTLRKQFEQSLMDANDQVQNMRQNCELLKNELVEKNTESALKISELNEQITVALEEKTRHETEIHKLQSEIERLNSTSSNINELSELLNAREQELATLKDELEKQQKEKSQLEENTSATVQQLTSELKDKETQLEHLNAVILEKDAETSKLTVELENLQGLTEKVKGLELSIEGYTTEIHGKNEEIHSLREKISEYETTLAEKEQQVMVQQSQLQQSATEMQHCTTQVQEQHDVTQKLTESENRVTTLNAALVEKEAVIEHNTLEVQKLQQEVQKLQQELQIKQSELEEVKNKLETAVQEQNSNIHKAVSNVQESIKHVEDDIPVFSGFGSDNNDQELQSLRAQLKAKDEEIEHLQYSLNEGNTSRMIQELQHHVNQLYNDKSELEEQITLKNHEIQTLKSKLEEVQHKQPRKRSLGEQEELIKLQNELHARDQEMNELKYIITEKESQLRAALEQASGDYELQESVERYKNELYEKQQELETLKFTVSELQSEVASLRGLERLAAEDRTTIERLNSEKEEVKKQAAEAVERALREKELEMDALKQQLVVENKHLMDTLGLRERDIENLKLQIEQTGLDKDSLIEQKTAHLSRLEAELSERERKLAELSITKDTEIHNIEVQLNEKTARVEELIALSEEENRQLAEMRTLLEVKEQQINGLTQQLDEKTKEYELMQHALQRHVSKAEQSTDVQQLQSHSSDGATNPASIASANELDVALYMLHQRDVRCEELTLELMQLLEERDTLQLRLSNAIRVNEELRKFTTEASSSPQKNSPTSEGASAEPRIENPSPSKSEGPVEIAKEAINSSIGEDKKALAQKLSQLKSVNQGKDVRLRDERELRYSQQMSLLAHKDVLSTLPPEAAARLVNANYTVSRDVQSQSSVLLNWLWGKSTPKVVHM